MTAKRTSTIDPVVGPVVSFPDFWRGRKATCLLIGEGEGPEGESVRVVGHAKKGQGFTVCYVHSYDQDIGNGERAYRYLLRAFGAPLDAVEVTSEAGIAFNRKMVASGVLSSMVVDLPGRDRSTGERLDPPAAPAPFRP
jgi:hypothetical protein